MDEEAYTSFENRMIAQLKNLELNPMVAFSDTLTKAIYDNNPRAARITADNFKQISYPRIMEMYKERFADASDFIFTFVGNIDTDSIRPFVEQYLATLPVKGRAEKPIPPKYRLSARANTRISSNALWKHRKRRLSTSGPARWNITLKTSSPPLC